MLIIDKIIELIVEEHPWILTFSVIIACIILLILLIVIIRRLVNGNFTIDFWIIKFNPIDTRLTNFQSRFNELDEHSQFKTHIIKLLNQCIMTISKWGNVITEEEYDDKVRSFYDFVLPGLQVLLTKHKNNSVRISVLIKEDNHLKILHGYGYSVEKKNYLRLGLTNSKAGNSYINNDPFSNGDLSKDPSFKRDPNSTRNYYSLICSPIVYDDKVIGVLNLDGLYKNSFDKDDEDYVGYFANVIAPLLNMELDYIESTKVKEESLHVQEEKSS